MADVRAEPLGNGVLKVVLAREAKRNALKRSMLSELLSLLTNASRDPGLRLVVLSAEGPAFCAGMDLAEMQATAAAPNATELWQADADLYKDVVLAIWNLRCPTMAVVQGPAVAGGVGLVAACDLVLAAESATFSLPEPRRGLTAAIVTPVLVHRVGPAAAAHLLLSGEAWSAATAFQRGLCDELSTADALSSLVEARVKTVLSSSPGALALTKANLRLRSAAVSASLDEAVAASAAARQTADAREGLQAFLEKRNPNWAR